jgi:hypothetical protein
MTLALSAQSWLEGRGLGRGEEGVYIRDCRSEAHRGEQLAGFE